MEMEFVVNLRKLALGFTGALMMAGAAHAAGPTAGATVYDTQGGVVGTIEGVKGDLATVSTGKNKVSVPVSAFGTGEKGPVLAMTRDQLDAAASGAKADAAAELKAQLAPGQTIYDTAGMTVGTVESSDAEFVTITVDDQKVKVPVNAFTKGEKGATIGMTAAQVKAAAAAGAAQSAAPATTTPAN